MAKLLCQLVDSDLMWYSNSPDTAAFEKQLSRYPIKSIIIVNIIFILQQQFAA